MSLIRCIIIFAVTFSCVLTARGDEGTDYYGDKPPVESIVLPGYSEETARDRLSSTPMQPIEGIWEYPDEMMTLVIERFSSPQFSRKLKYRIVLLSADDMSLLPGTVIGYIAESADNAKFELWLYSELDGKILTGASKCVATLDSDGNSLTFVRNEIKMRVRFNVMRFLPKIFRFISLSPYKDGEELPVGFRKVFPSYDNNGSQPGEVRYL